MPKPSRRGGIAPQEPLLYEPGPDRPVRAKQRPLSKADRVAQHRHAWAQLVFSSMGVVRLETEQGTYLAPPSRAVWIPPQVEHAVGIAEDAIVRTLYVHQPSGLCGPAAALGEAAGDDWRQCRVLEVSALLRALVLSLDTSPNGAPVQPGVLQRERLIVPLLLDELHRAPALSLGIKLPQDKRLRSLCQAMIEGPSRHATLQQWARDTGASPRTLARLFRDELGTSFGQWRRQVLLAQALALGAGGRSVGWIAGELGYASPSAFTAMVRRTTGEPPSRLLSQAAGARRAA